MANAIKLRKLSLVGKKMFIFLMGLIAVLFLVTETSNLPHKNRVTSSSSHGENTLQSKSVRHVKIYNISFNDLANSSLALDMVKNSTPAYSEENMKYSSKTKAQILVLKTDILASELKHRSAFKVNERISHDESASKNLTEKYTEDTERGPTLRKGTKTAYGFPLESTFVRKTKLTIPPRTVIPINEMNHKLFHREASYPSVKPRRSSKRDQELLSTKLQILNAPKLMTDQELYDPLFRNVSMFKRSYELMERMLKVYVYREGEKPIFHLPILKGIYASEGWFMKLMEGNRKFVVKDPTKAHLFYMPFSSRMLEHTLYVPNSHNMTNLAQYVKDYTLMIATKYPFWNRTSGADHFFVACHDWAPYETRHHHIAAGFKIGKDVSLPETYVRSARNPQRDIGGKPPSERHILAFFAGNMHGYLRPVLLSHWENKDPDMKIFGPMPPGVASKMNYINYMKNSKYCICAKGFEINSPRVVEAIFYECVPVIISDNFVPPFFEVLNWEAFSVIVAEKDIPLLKDILLSIPHENYVEMQLRVKKVRQHFVWHSKPVKYDLFHMILHSIWYNRVFMMKSR
ncbi:hypothetical protein Scep_024638 [Stephania cephalantha]|uniref:Exostosin GT47 domain-containing protein n=1 Tax=Stephania cephalantha TaxID=152367 RepID=A0AAP0F2D6_9MAGN